MATSKFMRYFRDGATGGPATGMSVWLVLQSVSSPSYPGDYLACSEHGTRDGVYYRASAPDGEYKIYIDVAGGTTPALYEENVWIGDKRVSDIVAKFDGSDNLDMDDQKILNVADATLDDDAVNLLRGKYLKDTASLLHPDTDISANYKFGSILNFVISEVPSGYSFFDGGGEFKEYYITYLKNTSAGGQLIQIAEKTGATIGLNLGLTLYQIYSAAPALETGVTSQESSVNNFTCKSQIDWDAFAEHSSGSLSTVKLNAQKLYSDYLINRSNSEKIEVPLSANFDAGGYKLHNVSESITEENQLPSFKHVNTVHDIRGTITSNGAEIVDAVKAVYIDWGTGNDAYKTHDFKITRIYKAYSGNRYDLFVTDEDTSDIYTKEKNIAPRMETNELSVVVVKHATVSIKIYLFIDYTKITTTDNLGSTNLYINAADVHSERVYNNWKNELSNKGIDPQVWDLSTNIDLGSDDVYAIMKFVKFSYFDFTADAGKSGDQFVVYQVDRNVSGAWKIYCKNNTTGKLYIMSTTTAQDTDNPVAYKFTELTGVEFVEYYLIVDWSVIPDATSYQPTSSYLQPALNSAKIKNYLDYVQTDIIERDAADLNTSLVLNNSTINVFKNALDKSSTFVSKLLNGDDVEVLLLGDSLFANQCDYDNADYENLPPAMQKQHVAYFLWKYANKNKPVYDRFDSTVNTFTEVGSWADDDDVWDSPGWSGEYRVGGSLTRYSATSSASVQFSWALADYEKLNFLYRKTTTGVQTVTITVAEGNGKIEMYNGSTWVEANAATFSMYINPATATEGSGYSMFMANVKLKMRRVATTGSVTITISKGANAETLYYWGTERWNRGAMFITNVARGGRTLQQLANNWKNDVLDRDADLILFELPLVNEYSNEYGDTDTILENVQDYVWGDRVGFLNSDSLKNLSTDFASPEVVLVLPHYRKEYVSDNDFLETYNSNPNDRTAFATWQAVKKLIRTQDDIEFIDMGAVFLREAESRNWTYEESVTTSTASSLESFTVDTVHTNRLGAAIWGRYLASIFDIAD